MILSDVRERVLNPGGTARVLQCLRRQHLDAVQRLDDLAVRGHLRFHAAIQADVPHFHQIQGTRLLCAVVTACLCRLRGMTSQTIYRSTKSRQARERQLLLQIMTLLRCTRFALAEHE